MKKQKGFSLIELLIVVAIILIIAAIAIPNLMRARMSANEASAAGSIRTINTGQISYATTFPEIGFAPNLAVLGGATPCTPSSSTGCFIDNVLAGGTKEGYSFATAGSPAGTSAVNVTYTSLGSPLPLNSTGTRSFCSDQTGVIYYLPGTACTASTGSVLQ